MMQVGLLTHKAYSTKMNFVIKHTCCTYFFAENGLYVH